MSRARGSIAASSRCETCGKAMLPLLPCCPVIPPASLSHIRGAELGWLVLDEVLELEPPPPPKPALVERLGFEIVRPAMVWSTGQASPAHGLSLQVSRDAAARSMLMFSAPTVADPSLPILEDAWRDATGARVNVPVVPDELHGVASCAVGEATRHPDFPARLERLIAAGRLPRVTCPPPLRR